MKAPRSLDVLSVEGFKSLRRVEELQFRALNVIIGANGAGKSNLVSLFRLLADLVEGRLQYSVAKAGGPEALLHLGSKVTPSLSARFGFGTNGYGFQLEPTATNQLIFTDEAIYWRGDFYKVAPNRQATSIGRGHQESKLREVFDADQNARGKGVVSYVYPSVRGWIVYHFHDTSETAGLKRRQDLADSMRLARDGANLAPLLNRLRVQHPNIYTTLRNTVRLAIPFFDDFEVDPLLDNPSQTELRWRQTSSDYRFHASQLSDGTLRFICLATALLQPFPPPTLIVDEPELGLHPYALTLLAGLVKQACTRTQVVLCTQSAQLLSEFTAEDVIVARHEDGASHFDRLDAASLASWLEDYTLGELGQKNLLGGRPSR